YRERGRVFEAQLRWDEAAADFEELVRLRPKDADDWNALCWALAVAGKPQAALEACNKSIELEKKSYTFDSRGLVNFKIANYEQAIEDYTVAFALDPSSWSSLYGRGLAKLKLGRQTSGEADIAKAKEMRPGVVQDFDEYLKR